MPMKRVVQSLLAAGFLVLAGLALFVVRPEQAPENRVDLRPRTSPVAGVLLEESTLRNVTKQPIVYKILPGPGGAGRTRTLGVGAVDRLVTSVPVQISFEDGRHTIVYLVHPGRPYSFRYDEAGIVKIYPGSHGRQEEADLAPYVPTPPEVAARMIELAGIGPRDVVYDLGCGDGRLVIAAAKTRGARGVGVELDENLLQECRAGAKSAGVEKRVRFERQDATKVRLTEATVVLVYLLPESLETLAPLFERDLAAGARIVSHDYRIPGWDDRLVRSEVLPGQSDRDHRVLLYKMPARR